MAKEKTNNCWVEIDLPAIRHNLREIKEIVGKNTSLMPVVKSEAYGHGASEVAKICQKEGVESFAVATVGEGVNLRKSGITGEILVLYNTRKEEVADALKYDISISLFKRNLAEKLNNEAAKQKKVAKVHIPVDTGMGWYGLSSDETLEFIDYVSSLKYIKIDGIYSHFSKTKSKKFSENQIQTFRSIIKTLEGRGITANFHLAKSSGVIAYDKSHMNMVRPGLMLYGIQPQDTHHTNVNLKPAMSFKTRVFQVRDLPKDTPISYDGTFVTKRDSKAAILPIGYSNGLSRYLSNRGEAIIRGKKFPIIGNICMNITIIDVTDDPTVKEEDEVTLMGKDGSMEITADNIADKVNTTCYEILTSIGSRNQRIYR